MRVRAVCIDDSHKPIMIPKTKWLKKGTWYHITYIFVMLNQNNIQGCSVAEIDISEYKPYNCFKLSRFAIHKDDLEKLVELMRLCAEMNGLKDFDAQKNG